MKEQRYFTEYISEAGDSCKCFTQFKHKLNKFQVRAFGNFPSLQESRHRANKGGNVISAI